MSSDSLQPLAHLLQLVLWGLYFLVHSLLATPAAKAAFAHRCPRRASRYPLFYSVVAVALLLPVASLVTAVPGPVLWRWRGALGWGMDGLALAALVAAWWAGRGYPLGRFLSASDPGAPPPPLVLSVLHRHVRHPWYALGLVVVWTRSMDLATLLSAASITAYLVVGSRLEDRKLVAAYGDAYRRYMARVPGLWPRPGHRLTPGEAAELLRAANEPAPPRASAPVPAGRR